MNSWLDSSTVFVNMNNIHGPKIGRVQDIREEISTLIFVEENQHLEPALTIIEGGIGCVRALEV